MTALANWAAIDRRTCKGMCSFLSIKISRRLLGFPRLVGILNSSDSDSREVESFCVASTPMHCNNPKDDA